MRYSILIFSGLFFFQACAPSQQVNFQELNYLGQLYTLEIFLNDGRTIQADSLLIDSDSARWIEPLTRAAVNAPTRSIHKIVRTDYALGAIANGCAWYGVTAAVGFILYFATGMHRTDGAGGKAFLYVHVPATIALTIGAISGANDGYKTEFILNGTDE